MISNLIGGLAIFFAFGWSFDVNDWIRGKGVPRLFALLGALCFFVGSVLLIGGASNVLLHEECADSHSPSACEADARGYP